MSEPLLKLGSTGSDVKVLKSLLQSQGFFAAEITDTFDEVTEDAVIYFQQTHLGRDRKPLDVDGEVGDNTWWALSNPSGEAQKSNIPSEVSGQLQGMRAKVLEIAAAEHKAGTAEIPDGSNWGDGVTKYLEGGDSPAAPWCCFFWSWCVHKATGAHPFGGSMGHVLTTWNTARKKGWAKAKEEYSPVPGDAFVMLNRNSAGSLTGTGHIGFVLGVDRKENAKSFNTIEGNCGNRVKVGIREMDQSTLVGFINQYPADEQPSDWQPGLIDASSVSGEGTR